MSTIPVTFKPPWMYFNNLPERARIRALAIAQAPPGATSAVVINSWHTSNSDHVEHCTVDFEVLGSLRTIRQHIIEPVLPGPELHWVQYTMSEKDPVWSQEGTPDQDRNQGQNGDQDQNGNQGQNGNQDQNGNQAQDGTSDQESTQRMDVDTCSAESEGWILVKSRRSWRRVH
ncbi:hypothetical protein PGQ11_001365 [Apiospora arundinis]|uniref:Uncharacterized protein n=1 Tax=Apiospora arundinis TaxID=335852 RepID=A0ABR2JNF1_9PEZI